MRQFNKNGYLTDGLAPFLGRVCHPFWPYGEPYKRSDFIIIVSLCFIGQVGSGWKLYNAIFIGCFFYHLTPLLQASLLSFWRWAAAMFEIAQNIFHQNGVATTFSEKVATSHFQKAVSMKSLTIALLQRNKRSPGPIKTAIKFRWQGHIFKIGDIIFFAHVDRRLHANVRSYLTLCSPQRRPKGLTL